MSGGVKGTPRPFGCSICIPDCNPEKTSSIRCRSLPGSHMGCLYAKLRYLTLERVDSYQSSVGSSWGVRSHSWGRRRAAYQGQGLQASIDERLDSSSGSSLVIVLSLGNVSQIVVFLVYLAVAGEQVCLAGSCLDLVQGWLALSSFHLESFHLASFRSLPER